MNIKNLYITGDTHGAVASRVGQLLEEHSELVPEETALIVLGDLGLNYYLNKKDKIHKQEVEEKGVYIYAVRGNHEARPSEKLGMHLIKDDFVGGVVWIEDDFPHIRYFTEWGIYSIQGLRTLVVGGAYSVDKFYRIQNGWRWFEDEQFTDYEMDSCYRNTRYSNFDLVLAHTCPKSWQPIDLFLNVINQSTVDDTMEKWMDTLVNAIGWKLFLFGHYHKNRIELPHVEQFYLEIESLKNIQERWENYDKTGKLDWWLPISPRMKSIMEEN